MEYIGSEVNARRLDFERNLKYMASLPSYITEHATFPANRAVKNVLSISMSVWRIPLLLHTHQILRMVCQAFTCLFHASCIPTGSWC